MPPTFPKNRRRLETHGLTKAFFDAVVAEALTDNLCSEHFSVDGTLIESFASAKSFRPRDAADEKDPNPPDGNGFKPGNPDVDFRGQRRTNETHASRTDPEAKLYRKGRGKEAKLSHMGHVLAENRNGLIVTVTATEANGTAERTATLDMLDDLKSTHDRVPMTLGGDKGYDDGDFFGTLEGRRIEPHIPLVKVPVDPKTVTHNKRRPGIRARRRMKRRMGTEGYRLSPAVSEEGGGVFRVVEVGGEDGRSRVVGRWKLRQLLEVSAAAFNLVRMRRLAPVVG